MAKEPIKRVPKEKYSSHGVNLKRLREYAEKEGIDPMELINKYMSPDSDGGKTIKKSLVAIEKMMTIEEVIAAFGALDSELLKEHSMPDFGKTFESRGSEIDLYSVKILDVDCTAYYHLDRSNNIIRLVAVKPKSEKAPAWKLNAINEITKVFMREGDADLIEGLKS